MLFESARSFIYKNARPLDLARWRYLFEGGGREDVLTALAAYQNGDGGFGHALEPDCWNPESSPIQTWAATEILGEIGLTDGEHPIIRGILAYLASGKDFDGHVWANAVPSNNLHPHAGWWEYSPGQPPSYNPTAALIGFILRFAPADGGLYAMARRLAEEAWAAFRRDFPTDSMHTAACFVELYEVQKARPDGPAEELEDLGRLLREQIRHVITYDTSVWGTDYVCRPSLFIRSRSSEFYAGNEEICRYECDFIADSQNPDGAWDLTWAWEGYPEQWHISKNWWKSDWIIKNLRFLRAMGADAPAETPGTGIRKEV